MLANAPEHLLTQQKGLLTREKFRKVHEFACEKNSHFGAIFSQPFFHGFRNGRLKSTQIHLREEFQFRGDLLAAFSTVFVTVI